MRRKSAIFTLFLFSALFALANPKDSLRLEQKNGAKYIVHRVSKSETITSIAAKYSVTESEILSSNPLITEKVFTGQIVKVPVNESKYGSVSVKPVEPLSNSTLPTANNSGASFNGNSQNPSSKNNDNIPFKTYVVASPQTVQHLAESFLMDPKDIIELNNLKNNNLKEGQKVKIPLRTDPPPVIAKVEPKPVPAPVAPKAIAAVPAVKPSPKPYYAGEAEKPYIENKPASLPTAKVETPPVKVAEASKPQLKPEPIKPTPVPVAQNSEAKVSIPVVETPKAKPEPKVLPPTAIVEKPKEEPKAPAPVAIAAKPKEDPKPIPPIAVATKPKEEPKSVVTATTPKAEPKPISIAESPAPKVSPAPKTAPLPPVKSTPVAVVAKPEIKEESMDINDDSMMLVVIKKQRKREQLNRLDSEYIHPDGIAYKVFNYKETDYQFDVHTMKVSEENAIDVNSVYQRKGKGDKNTTHMVKYGETLQSIARNTMFLPRILSTGMVC